MQATSPEVARRKLNTLSRMVAWSGIRRSPERRWTSDRSSRSTAFQVLTTLAFTDETAGLWPVEADGEEQLRARSSAGNIRSLGLTQAGRRIRPLLFRRRGGFCRRWRAVGIPRVTNVEPLPVLLLGDRKILSGLHDST